MEHREVRHGATVIDPYFWLREKSNPEVIKYLEAENAYTEAMTKDLKPFEEALYKEMLGRIKQTDLSVPVRRGAYLYYSRTEEGKQYPIQCRRKGSMEAPEEILLDLNELAKGHKFVGLGAFVVSDDHNLLAYTIDYTGFRQYALHVKDLRTGETAARHHRARHLRCLGRRQQDAVPAPPRTPSPSARDKLWRHVLWATPSSTQLYDEKDELYDIGLGRTRDKKYLFLRHRKQGHHGSPLPAGRPSRRRRSACSCRARRSTGTTSIIAKDCSTSAPTRTRKNFQI